MSLPLSLLRYFQSASAQEVWQSIFSHTLEVSSGPLQASNASAEITRRDRSLGVIDLALATAGWDLWYEYEASVELTSDALTKWWQNTSQGRAILILDALSLREIPWLLEGAKKHGFSVNQVKVTGSELPADTTFFAKALGFSQRSSLENNGAGGSHKLSGAFTDCVSSPWKDCIELITAHPDWVLWHCWPDDKLHALSVPGEGLAAITSEVTQQLGSDDFWKLIYRLTAGRKLIITTDHGYAASGHFPDTTDDKQTEYLKSRFKSGRWSPTTNDYGTWVPPIELVINSRHGKNAFVLGRRKWKSPGGYPTLTHGGLSILEVAVPFIELSRSAGV